MDHLVVAWLLLQRACRARHSCDLAFQDTDRPATIIYTFKYVTPTTVQQWMRGCSFAGRRRCCPGSCQTLHCCAAQAAHLAPPCLLLGPSCPQGWPRSCPRQHPWPAVQPIRRGSRGSACPGSPAPELLRSFAPPAALACCCVAACHLTRFQEETERTG